MYLRWHTVDFVSLKRLLTCNLYVRGAPHRIHIWPCAENANIINSTVRGGGTRVHDGGSWGEVKKKNRCSKRFIELLAAYTGTTIIAVENVNNCCWWFVRMCDKGRRRMISARATTARNHTGRSTDWICNY